MASPWLLLRAVGSRTATTTYTTTACISSSALRGDMLAAAAKAGIRTNTRVVAVRALATGTNVPKNKILLPQVQYDQVGPAHPGSNLRQWRFVRPEGEGKWHKKCRELRQDTLDWSNTFWIEHNESFTKERAAFMKKIIAEKYPNEPAKTTLSAEEMSMFYREFLNKKWSEHLRYNMEWQRRNFSIIGLMFMAKLEGLSQRMM